MFRIQCSKGRKLLDDGDGQGSAEEHFEEKLFKIKDRMKVSSFKVSFGLIYMLIL